MASWLTHLRVSERLCDKIKISDNSLFFAGSIAPDTDISPDISHWCINGDKRTCDVSSFYCKYISNCNASSDFAFYLGYYVHLLTDIMWHKQKNEPIKTYDKAIIKNIKESWKSVDYYFLSIHKDFFPIVAVSDTAKFKKQWFDYYILSQVKELIEHIIESSKVCGNETLYIDMNVKNEIERFIDEAATNIFQLHRNF